jgi:hypothetical protein
MTSKIRCANCKECHTNLVMCSGCRKVRYCGKECQKADWSPHKRACKQAQESAVPHARPRTRGSVYDQLRAATKKFEFGEGGASEGGAGAGGTGAGGTGAGGGAKGSKAKEGTSAGGKAKRGTSTGGKSAGA